MDEFNGKNLEENRLLFSAQALRNQIRQQIFLLLSNKNSCSFNEIYSQLEISRPKLSYHLQILTKYNIISNFYDKRQGVKDHSFYELTHFGRELVLEKSLPLQAQQSQSLQINPEQYLEDSNNINFRTINNVKYESLNSFNLKHSKGRKQRSQSKKPKFSDPMLNNVVIKSHTSGKTISKVVLPSFRIYYKNYKRPFISKDELGHKY
jgi:predicted transcriptional regulator